jgi:toxin YoeB
MEIIFAPKALSDIEYWKFSGNKNIQKKISQLINSIRENPFNGIGKPEPLKHEFSGCWSRRINEEHRLIYEVGEHSIEILSLKDHY